jgi:mannose/cellobiose epimerase-like protein (N-acyl-D-glucosamine 2-epimerase family)
MLETYLKSYKKALHESVVPFWLQHSLDQDCGGTFSCLDRDGTVYDTKKYIWLQGRSVWMFSRLYNECGRQQTHLDAARLGVEFLEKNALDEQGRYYFSLTREGAPTFFQRKPYSAVFAMLAYLEYAKASGQDEYKQKAVDLFWKITQWIEDPELLERPTLAGAPQTSSLANVMVLNVGIAFVAISAFPAVILGGLESIPGAIIGGLTIGILENMAGGYLDQIVGGGIKDVTPFAVLFLVLMIKPYGLFGTKEVERV